MTDADVQDENLRKGDAMAGWQVETEVGGTVWKLECTEGATVAEGDALLSVESA